MELAEGIRQVGFRRWYERQLIESHLYLVSALLCLIAVLACLEGFSLRAPGWETPVRFAAIFASGAGCLWTLRRYLVMLKLATYAAQRSVCEKCGTYGGLELSGVSVRHAQKSIEDGSGILSPVGVRCRKCGREWIIE